MASPADRICSNCEHSIPSAVYELHTVHCFRHRFKCDTCKEMIPRSDQTVHMEEHRRKEKCPHCAGEFESGELGKHVEECSMLPRSCEYCGAHFDLVALVEHTLQCGARTDECSNCKSLILLKDMSEHLMFCLAADELSQEEANSRPKPRKRLRKAADAVPVKKASRRH